MVANVPVLILGNKIDAPNAQGEPVVRNYFGLNTMTTGKVKYKIVGIYS